MQLTYTGPEALDLVNTVLPNAKQTIPLCKATLTEYAETHNCSLRLAYSNLLKANMKPTTAIFMFVALYQLERDINLTESAAINNIKHLEHEKEQIGQQLFVLEHSYQGTGKTSLRQIYLEQLAHKDKQIQQHLNTITVSDPIIINQKPNC